MSDVKAEIKRKWLNSRFYRPINQIEPEHTVYYVHGIEMERFFEEQPNDLVYGHDDDGASASSLQFDETNIYNGKDRDCQVCTRTFKNARHSNKFKAKNMCCVCRLQFKDPASLKMHVAETIEKNKCCKPNCPWPLTGDPEQNRLHFHRH